jgi:hypothetical protein
MTKGIDQLAQEGPAKVMAVEEAKIKVDDMLARTQDLAQWLKEHPNATPEERVAARTQFLQPQTRTLQPSEQLSAGKLAVVQAAAKELNDKIPKDMPADQRAVKEAENWGTAMRKASGTGGEGDFTPQMADILGSLAEKGVSLPVGLRSKQQQVATLQGIIDAHPDMSADEIADGIKSGQIEFKAQTTEAQSAGRIAGQVLVAENEMKTMVPLVQQASDAVPRGDFIPITKLLQTADTSISDPNLLALKIRINSLLNSYDLLAARAGTDMEKRATTRALLLSATGPDALKAGLDSFMKEAKAAGQAANTAIEEVGKKGGDFPTPPAEAVKMLKADPSTADHFDEIFGPGAAEKILKQK